MLQAQDLILCAPVVPVFDDSLPLQAVEFLKHCFVVVRMLLRPAAMQTNVGARIDARRHRQVHHIACAINIHAGAYENRVSSQGIRNKMLPLVSLARRHPLREART